MDCTLSGVHDVIRGECETMLDMVGIIGMRTIDPDVALAAAELAGQICRLKQQATP
jgi:hypothetical protein